MLKRRSLFFQLLVIYGLTFFAIVISFGVAKRLTGEEGHRERIARHMKQYGSYIVKDIGLPPSRERAKEIGKSLNMEFRFIGPGFDWATAPNFEGRFRTLEMGEWKIQFDESRHARPEVFALVFLSLCIVVFSLSYHAVRRTFRPLERFKVITEAISEGQYDQRVPTQERGEFGRLGDSINKMAEKIESRIAAMNRLMIAVSHELRSPLTRIRVSTEFIDNEKVKNAINEEVSLLDDLTFNLLESERLKNQTLNRQTVPLVSHLNRTLGPLGISLDESQDFQANVDPVQVEIAVKNLVENAIRYAEDVSVDLRREEGTVFIEVRDRGPGLPKMVRENFGEPFLRAESSRDRESGGFGFGLHLAYSICRAHGGDLKVESSDGGTKFTMILN